MSAVKGGETIAGNDQTNFGVNVDTPQVQQVVHIFMAIIVLMIIVFLIVHLFIRFHYKAKTEYALAELREKYERSNKGPSPYSVPKDPKDPKKAEVPVGKPIEVVLDPEQLAPILHQVALAPPGRIEEPNKNIFYKAAP